MRDLNYRNKFKDGDIEVYRSVRALEKLINSVFNRKPGPAREAFDEIVDVLMQDFVDDDPDKVFAKLYDPKSMADVLQSYASLDAEDRLTPIARAWTLTAAAYLTKLPAL